MITGAQELPRLTSPSTTDVSTLVRRAQSGDERAFETLYDIYGPKIHALSLRMTRSPSAAEDVLQDVFFRAWRSLSRFRHESSFGTWLYSIAVRMLIDRHRHLPPEHQAEGGERFTAIMPGANIDLERAIGTLPERARLALLLAVAGHRYEEIATIMEIEVGTVKSQIHRARRLVREALS